MTDDQLCEDCGKPEGTFACKIRHVQLNTGAANSKREWEAERKKAKQLRDYGV